jgi:hypothetical protein
MSFGDDVDVTLQWNSAASRFDQDILGASQVKAASFAWIETGLGNSGTNAPAAANDVLFLRSDGLSKADAASLATSVVRGAYTGTSGEAKRGTAVVLAKMFTDAGGTTYDNVAKGDLIWLAAAVADEYDTGVTPAKGRCSSRAPVIGTAGTVNFLLGTANAASDGDWKSSSAKPMLSTLSSSEASGIKLPAPMGKSWGGSTGGAALGAAAGSLSFLMICDDVILGSAGVVLIGEGATRS